MTTLIGESSTLIRSSDVLSPTLTTTTEPVNSIRSPEEMLAMAMELARSEQYLNAASWLEQLRTQSPEVARSLLQPRHYRIMEIAEVMKQTVQGELAATVSEHDSEWKKQTESHAQYDFLVYYKIDQQYRLNLRIDIVMESSLLLPILSVFNESDLFSSWMPSWKHPRAGLRQSVKLHEAGRGNQVILLTVDIPKPFVTRELVLHALAIDAIDSDDSILIYCSSCEPGYYNCCSDETVVIPEPDKQVVRIHFDAAMAIRACPQDHPALKNSKRVYPPPPGEAKVLLSIKQHIDAHVSYIPVSVVNFIGRIAAKQMVINLIHVAEEIRSGKRPDHKMAIDSKPDLYAWVRERIDILCSKLAA